MGIKGILLSITANAVRTAAIKKMVDTFIDKKACLWKFHWILYVFFWGLTSTIYHLFYYPPFNLLCNVLGLILILLPYHIKTSRKALTIFLIYGINALDDSIVVFAFSQYQYGNSVNPLQEYVTSLVMFLAAMIMERTIKAEKDSALPVRYQTPLGIVPIISIGIIFYVVKMGDQFRGIILFTATGLLIINILNIYIYQSLIQFYSAYMEQKMQEQIMPLYAQELEIIQESHKNEKNLWHDMNHHIIELKTLLKGKKIQEAQEYLKEMEQFLTNSNETVATGNQEVDGILDYMMKKANRVLKEVKTQINIPEGMFHGNFKLCTILGNLLDNAIREAQKTERRYLSVEIFVKSGILFLFIENSYSGNIIKRKETFKTTQKDAAHHGIGLENVRKMIDMCGGEINISNTEDIFKVEALLYINSVK